MLVRASEGVGALWCSPAEGDWGEISVVRRTILRCQNHAAEETPLMKEEGFSGVRSLDAEGWRCTLEVLYIAAILVDGLYSYWYWSRRRSGTASIDGTNGGLEEAHCFWKSLVVAWPPSRVVVAKEYRDHGVVSSAVATHGVVSAVRGTVPFSVSARLIRRLVGLR